MGQSLRGLAPVLDRLGVDRSNWVHTVRDFGRMFEEAAGRASSLCALHRVSHDAAHTYTATPR